MDAKEVGLCFLSITAGPQDCDQRPAMLWLQGRSWFCWVVVFCFFETSISTCNPDWPGTHGETPVTASRVPGFLWLTHHRAWPDPGDRTWGEMATAVSPALRKLGQE